MTIRTNHGDNTPERPWGTLAGYAWDELNRAGLFDKSSDYYGALGVAVLELIEVFAGQGHSGTSAGATVELFQRLVRFQPLSDLTDDPSEWMEVTDGLWQSRRMPEAFSRDGGRTYRRNSTGDRTYTSVESKKARNSD